MAKVRITSLGNNAKQLNWPVNPGMLSEPEIEVNSTLKPVDRADANLEAEKGETVVTDMMGDGIPQQYIVGGKRHSEGGTPLDLPEKSFVFSRDKGMLIKDEKVQKMFGMTPDKKGYTPAEIAKKYDLNKYRKILADPDTDELQRKTAEMMIAQYNMKLAKLALVQESMKGFPQGIPTIAEPYITAGIINPQELAITQAQPETPGGTEMQYGGPVKRKVRITALPQAGDGKEVKHIMRNKYNKNEGVFNNATKEGIYEVRSSEDSPFRSSDITTLQEDASGNSLYKDFRGMPYYNDGFYAFSNQVKSNEDLAKRLNRDMFEQQAAQRILDEKNKKIDATPKKLPGKIQKKESSLEDKMNTYVKMETERKAKEAAAKAAAANQPGVLDKIKQFGLNGVKPIMDWYYDPASDIETLNMALDKGFKEGFDTPVTGSKSPITGKNAPKQFTYGDVVETLNKKVAEKKKQYAALQQFYAANEQKLKGITTPEIDATRRNEQWKATKAAAKPVKTLPNKDIEVVYTDEEF